MVLTADDKSRLADDSRGASGRVCRPSREASRSAGRRPSKKRARGRIRPAEAGKLHPELFAHTRRAGLFAGENTKVHSPELATREIPLGALLAPFIKSYERTRHLLALSPRKRGHEALMSRD